VTVDDVREYLRPFGRADDILEFSASSATVALAAAEVGTEPERIAKTLAVSDPDDPAKALLIVTAGDAKLHNGSFKRRFGAKPRMLSPEQVEPLTGHPVGGVCPFANPPGTRVFLDESLRRFDVVYPAAGSPNSAIGLTLADLERLSQASGWVDIAAGWRR